MLDNLSQRLAKIVKTMRGQARLTEANTKEMLREVRLALLEADVALPVVREVLARIKADAMGEEVVGNLNPGQALVGVVQRELTRIIGGDLSPEERSINLRVQPPAVILLAGLQGAGKTTTAGKLAKFLIETMKKKVLLVSCDVYRPAAIEQLRTVAEQAGAAWHPSTTGDKPLDIVRCEEGIGPRIALVEGVAMPGATLHGAKILKPRAVAVARSYKALEAVVLQVGVPEVRPLGGALVVGLGLVLVAESFGHLGYAKVVVGVLQVLAG